MLSNWLCMPIAWIVSAAAAASPLGLLETQRLAVAEQPLLEVQRANSISQRAAASAAQQLPDPKLKLALQNVPIDTFSLSEDFMTQRTVAIEQMFPGGKKRALRGRRGEQEAQQSEAELAVAQRAIQRDSALAWLDLYYLVQNRLLLREQQQELRANVAALRIGYAADKVSQAEVLAVQNGLHQLGDRTLELDGQIARARAMLARWIGAAAEREVDPVMPTLSVLTLDQLLAQIANHAELRVYEKNIATSETDVLLAREARRPDWSLEVAYSKRGRAYADMVSLQLGFELPVSPASRQDQETAAKHALLERVRFQREDRLRSLAAEIQAEYADYRAAMARIAALENTTLDTARQRIAAARIAYQNAKGPLNMVYEAHHAELDTRLQLLAQRVASARAAIRLRYLSAEEI